MICADCGMDFTKNSDGCHGRGEDECRPIELERRTQKAKEEFEQYPEWVQKMSIFQGGEVVEPLFKNSEGEND